MHIFQLRIFKYGLGLQSLNLKGLRNSYYLISPFKGIQPRSSINGINKPQESLNNGVIYLIPRNAAHQLLQRALRQCAQTCTEAFLPKTSSVPEAWDKY